MPGARRGRDAGYPTPPAQIPACGITAPGSCLGSNVQAPEGACRTRSGTCDRDDPALCPVPGMLRRVPLGPLPSLHLLRQSLGATVVRRLPRCRVGGGARRGAPPSAAQTARAVLPHAAFTKSRRVATGSRKASARSGSPAPTHPGDAGSGRIATPHSASACGGVTTAVAPPIGLVG